MNLKKVRLITELTEQVKPNHYFIDAQKDAEGAPTKLEDMIRELSGALTGIKHEQEYMQVSLNQPNTLKERKLT